ncbi:MAG: hypothetical protein ACREDR_06900 [Blastocatellia bacterium]
MGNVETEIAGSSGDPSYGVFGASWEKFFKLILEFVFGQSCDLGDQALDFEDDWISARSLTGRNV